MNELFHKDFRNTGFKVNDKEIYIVYGYQGNRNS